MDGSCGTLGVQKQTLATLSSCEAELSASTHGLKIGLGVRAVAEEVTGRVLLELQGDNMAMIQTILNEVTSWRSRHYAVRAAWARDTVKEQCAHLKHVPGIDLIADPLTKVLTGPELPSARKKLGMVDVSETAVIGVPQDNKDTAEGTTVQLRKDEPT